jgi:hypothetical protein
MSVYNSMNYMYFVKGERWKNLTLRPGVGIEILLQRVVHRHLMVLATFLMEPEPPALALRKVVFLAIEQGNPRAKRMTKGPDSRKP